jgi:hypothetical protein
MAPGVQSSIADSLTNRIIKIIIRKKDEQNKKGLCLFMKVYGPMP